MNKIPNNVMDAEKKDTPRTDAFEKQRIVEATTNDIATEAWADFARQLERELKEAKSEQENVINGITYDLTVKCDSLRRQNERLREALKIIRADAHYINKEWMINEGHDQAAETIQAIRDNADKALAAQPEETK